MNKWWKMTYSRGLFSPSDNKLSEDSGKKKRSRRACIPLLFPVLGCFPPFPSLSITFSFLPSNHVVSSLPSAVSVSEWSCIFPAVHETRGKKSKTNHSDALHNVINEAWENLSHNTCLHEVAQGDWLLPDAVGCLWTKKTHTRNPFRFRATLSIWWVPTERSFGVTDCTYTLQGVEERYLPFMKSKMENPFSQADS